MHGPGSTPQPEASPAPGEAPLSAKRDLTRQAAAAAEFIKLLASPVRLQLLCHVADDEVSVGELAELTGMRMPTVSQQLSLLRAKGIVQTRREGTTIYYRRSSALTREIMDVLMRHFCPPAS